MRRTLFLSACLLVMPLVGCEQDGSDSDVEVAQLWIQPAVAGVGTELHVELEATRSRYRFGATDLDLGEGVTVNSVTVMDGYHAVAEVVVDPDAELGPRDAVIHIENTTTTLRGAFEVIAESISVDPDRGKMGEIVRVQIQGRGTDWVDSSSWAGFGPNIDVIDFEVVAPNGGIATVAIHPDAKPGPRDVSVQEGTHVVTLYDGFMVDRAVLTAVFQPDEAYQGDTVEFTLHGVDTRFKPGNTTVEFWDDGGINPDVQVTEFNVVHGESATGRVRLSNAARVGLRDIYVRTELSPGEWEAVLIPDGFNVLDAPPDLANVAVGLAFDVLRQIDNDTGELLEQVNALAYFIIPLDPPCGSAPPPGSGPAPYDQNGVFPSPPPAEPADCPNPETVSAGDFVWFESPVNVVTLEKDLVASTNQTIYRGVDLTLDDYQFNQIYDLHTQGDPEGIPEVTVPEVQPTVPGDFYILSPGFWGDMTINRAEPFPYTWTPAQTYPNAIFGTQISGALVDPAALYGGFVGSLPWDDGEHEYTPSELSQMRDGPVSFAAYSYIEGRYFGLPFSTIQTNQSDSVLQTGAQLILE